MTIAAIATGELMIKSKNRSLCGKLFLMVVERFMEMLLFSSFEEAHHALVRGQGFYRQYYSCT